MKTTIVLSYQNYELSILVFGVSNKQLNLVYDKQIGAWDLLAIQDDMTIANIKSRVHQVLPSIKQKFPEVGNNIYVLVDGTKEGVRGALTAEARVMNITVNVPNKHAINMEDLKKIDKDAYSRSSAIEGKTYTGFLTEGYQVGGREIKKPLDQIVVDNFKVIGSHHYVSTGLIQIFETIFKDTPYNIRAIYDTDYVFKKFLRIPQNAGIIEVGRKDTKFYVNNDRSIQTICTAIGLVNFFNNTFDNLAESYEQDLAQQAVFFLKQHFVFTQQREELMINEQISYNEATNIFKNVLVNYFEYFHKELRKGHYHINDFQLIVNGYDSQELAELLTQTLDLQVTPFKVTEQTFTPGICNPDQLAIIEISKLKAMLVMQDIVTYRNWEIR